MSNCKIICEIPNKEIIYLDCEYQNIKEELQKKKNNLNQDSIVLIDISETVYQATKIKNNLMRDQMYFKVYDANQLQRELKEMAKIKVEKEQLINQDNTLLQRWYKEFDLEAVSITSLKSTLNQMEQKYQNQLSQFKSQLQLNAYTNHVFQMNNLENMEFEIEIVEDQVQSQKKVTLEQKQLFKQIKEKLKNDSSETSSKYQEDGNAIKLSKEIQGKLIEAEQKLSNLAEEMKEKEKYHYMKIQQLSENNRTQTANILRTQQAEMEKIQAEKQKQIYEISERRDILEVELNRMNIRFSNLEQENQQLQEDYLSLQRSFEVQLKNKNEELMVYTQKILNEQWQNYVSQIYSQFQLQFEQYQKHFTQEIEQLVERLEQQQTDFEEEQKYDKKERDELKQQLKTKRDELLKAQLGNFELECTISDLNDKIKKLERKRERERENQKLSKNKIGELENAIKQLEKYIEFLQKGRIV
ncbi:unnamed protein product [Paramecium octaurelia]|uniref:Uncharacterized protein n=1 Tax=Paramecium octaurelia TaxID=43137 RepID=A0A8S1WM30_PAROT|nr:unnamed protein product [Paramecium octaurelia]